MFHYELGIKKMVKKKYCVACLQILKQIFKNTLFVHRKHLSKKHHLYSNEKNIYILFI